MNVKNYRYSIIILIGLILSSCQPEGFKTHSTGLQYKFIKKNNNQPLPQPGEYIHLRMEYTTMDDSLLFTTKMLDKPFIQQLSKPSHDGGSLEDALAMMHIGDSMQFAINAGLFYKATRQTEVPEGINPDENILFYVRLVDILTLEEIREMRTEKETHSLKSEQKKLEHYLRITNTTVEPTKSGMYFIEEKPGTGEKPDTGKTVVIHYTGTFTSGKIFYTTLKENKPIEFVVGSEYIIDGWNEALTKMKEGGRYKLILPSKLAYGKKGKGLIPPYTPVIFEIELLQVK